MEFDTHIAIGSGIISLLLFLDLLNGISTLFVLVFIFSASVPDVDLVLGLKYHRRGTHTIFAGILYACIMTGVVGHLSQWLYGFTSVALIITIVIIGTIYYRGDTKEAINKTFWIALLSIVIALELGDLSANMSNFQILIATGGGYLAHLVGDYIAAGGRSKMKLLYPYSRKFGVRIFKTGGKSERGLFGLLIFGIFISLFLKGGNLPALISGIPLIGEFKFISIIIISIIISLIATYASATNSSKFDLA